MRNSDQQRLVAGGTTVEFTWAGDRWAHGIHTSGGEWRSVEGSAAGGSDRWPASPVLTELSLVEIGGRVAVLGIGSAGRSHFSVSVTPHPDTVDTVIFEAACRIHEPAPWLGSTYRDADGGIATLAAKAPAAPATVRWSYAAGPEGIVPIAPPRSPVTPGR